MTRARLISPLLGPMQHETAGIWRTPKPIPVPYFGGAECSVTYVPDGDAFIAEADKLVASFLAKTFHERTKATLYVFNHCKNYLEACGDDDPEVLEMLDHVPWGKHIRPMVEMKDPEQVWAFVRLYDIWLAREQSDDEDYLSLHCRCEWDEEHGLQLVFNPAEKLIRVSSQDGDMIGWGGDGMISDQ